MIKIICRRFSSMCKSDALHSWQPFIKLFSAALFVFAFGCSSTHKTNRLFENSSAPWSDARRTLKAGETYTDSIYLSAGNMIHIKIEQYGIDVIAKVSSADGKYAEQFDSPTGELGAEDIYLLRSCLDLLSTKLFEGVVISTKEKSPLYFRLIIL